MRARLAALATFMVVSILPAGATVFLVDLGALALVALAAEGLVIDFLDTAMVVFLTFGLMDLKSVDGACRQAADWVGFERGMQLHG